MTRFKVVLFTLAAAVVLAGCGGDAAKDELNAKDTEKAEAKVDVSADKEVEKEEAKEDEDIWTYYEDAKWSEDFNGLKTEIQKVVVSDIAPTSEDEKAETSAVGVKFSIENTSDGVFTTYPDQAVLVTSTGEQLDSPDMWVSDDIGGEIHEGVIKEGNVIWYLERGKAEAIEWVKIEWMATDETLSDAGDYDNSHKEYSVKLDLK